MIRSLLSAAAVVLACASCSLFSAADTSALTQAVAGLDAKFVEQRIAAEKLIEYGAANGMPSDSVNAYRVAFDGIARDFERLRFATLAAVAELGEVPLTDILAAVERAAAVYTASRGNP